MPLTAVRTVSEDENQHTIEGLLAYGGPFNGKDTYGTFFSARTDYALAMHPAGIPVLFNHGFDPDFGYNPIGHTEAPASWRTDDDGLWVQMQLDKRHKYYASRVRPLIEQSAVGASQGSAEHSVRIDDKTGEVLVWPLHEISLTPTEANPWSVVAARSADIISIVDAVRKQMDPNVGGGVDRDKIPDEDFAGPNRSFPIVTPGDVSDAASSLGRAKGNRSAIKAKIIAIARRKGDDFAAQLPDSWRSVEVDAPADLDEDHPTTDAGLTDKATALRDALDAFLAPDEDPAVRAGRRNSTSDQQHIDAIHAHATALGASAHSDNQPADDADDDDAARTAEPLTTVRIVEREDAPVPRLDLDAIAARAAAEAVKRLTG